MASSAASSTLDADLRSFSEHLQKSTRILALCGAGLSASSGLPTFRGAGGLWRTHDSISLATPEAFSADPGLVWQFYSYRRHMAMNVQPNRAHLALAELARRNKQFMCLSQNVDGLSQRANHPPASLQLLHGTLFEVKCSRRGCHYRAPNFIDPIVPALAIPTGGVDPTSDEARQAVSSNLAAKQEGKELDISDEKVALPSLALSDLPKCPQCKTGLLRPGVVWFGESLPHDVLNTVNDYMSDGQKIDLIMVIGTSSKVYPAAGYIEEARSRGARVAVFNMDEADAPAMGLMKGDWFFKGDSAELVPRALESVVGEIRMPKEKR